jgi:hypothetical protein
MRGHWNIILEPNYVAETPGALKSVFDPAAEPITPEEASEQAALEAADHAESMLASFDLIEGKIVDGILAGRAYKGHYFSLHPSVRGTVLPGQTVNDVEHKIGLTCAINSKMKSLLNAIKLTVKGQKDFEDFAKITTIEDAETERTDGFVTPGDELYIHGERIKVAGDEDDNGKVIEEGIGVFFVPDNGSAPLPARRVRQNTASFLSVKMPNNLSDNTQYTLKIVTRYTGSILLNSPRTIVCHKKLFTVDPPTPDPNKGKQTKNKVK